LPDSTVPIATVPRIVRRRHKLRKARGFSLGELQQAGLMRPQAFSMGIRIDTRRTTSHVHNVNALKTFLNSSPAKAGVTQGPTEPSTETTEPEEADVVAKEEPKSRRKARPKAKNK